MPRRSTNRDFAHSLISNSGVSVGPTATSIPVVDGSQFPDTANGKFTIRFPSTGEVCRVNTRVGNVFTSVTRGLPEGAAGTYSGTTILDGSECDEIWGSQDIADVEDYIPPLDGSNITSGTISSSRLPANVSSIKKTGSTALTGDVTLTGSTGVTLTQSGQDISIAASVGGGSGTVTSVSLSLPADFTVSGSPVTGSGTLTAVRNTQSANTVFAGPTTGSPASPTYRLLVGADLPAATTTVQGAVTLSNVTPTADGTGTIGTSTAAARADHAHPLVTSFSSEVTVPDLKVTGVAGSVQAMRVVGATSSGAPVAGAHLVGDASLSLADAKWYVCTVAGTPGTFVSPAGSGTVTSVGLSVPSALLNVSGSPITGSGTLAVSLATQSANTVLAGPTTGSPATPTMRALVGADLPTTVVTMAPAPSGDASGVTDNAALQAIHDGWTSSGGTLRLQGGGYYITGLVVTKPMTIMGQLESTTVTVVSSTAVGISVGTGPFIASGFSLQNTGATVPTAGAGIASSANHALDRMRLTDMVINGFYINLDLQNASNWHVHRCEIVSPVLHAMRIANPITPDAGDMSIIDCIMFPDAARNTAPPALVRYESGGGLRFIGNKLNGTPGSLAAVCSVDVAIADGASTGDLLFLGNSIENFSSYGLRIHLKGASNTGTFGNIVLTGNQISSFASGSPVALAVTPEATGGISSVVIGDNVFSHSAIGVSLANVDDVTLGANTYKNITTTVSVGSGVTNLTQFSTSATATTSGDGVVRVDNNSSGDPVAVTLAGYLASLTGLTQSNLDAAAGVLLSQLGQSGAILGQVPTWNGSAYAPADAAGSSHLHGLARWVAGGGTAFDLPDIAEYIELAYDNGTAVDATTVTLSANRTQLLFDVAPTTGHVLQIDYVIARI